MKKTMVILGVLVVVLFASIFYFFSYDCDHNTYISSNSNKKDILKEESLSMMLETEVGSGEYEMVTQSSWPTEGYIFNKTLSKCENGSDISWDDTNKLVLFDGNSKDRCYVYFSKMSELNLALNDYIFSWNTIDGASSYQIYSDDTLLTTTTDTSAEIWKLYEDAGIYNIMVNAVDSSNNSIFKSNSVSYNLEQLDLNLSGSNVGSPVLENSTESDYLYSVNVSSKLSYISSPATLDLVNLINQNYSINYVGIQTYGATDSSTYGDTNIFLTYSTGDGSVRLYTNYNIFKKTFCWTSNLCHNTALSNFVYDYHYKIYYDSSTSNFKANVNSGYSSYLICFFQIVEQGSIATDWYYFAIYSSCLSSNTDIYVYDRKKKKFKKKRIGDLSYDDEVLCWDFDKGEFAIAKPIWLQKRQITNKYNLLKFSDGSTLETIDQHRIFNVEKGKFTYPMTDDTPIGTTTFNSSGEYVKLVSKEVIEEPMDYYNLNIEEHINVFANGILTSCRLNNMYLIENMKYVYDKKRDNGIDLSDYDERLVNGLRLKEQEMTEEEIRKYVDYRETIRKI